MNSSSHPAPRDPQDSPGPQEPQDQQEPQGPQPGARPSPALVVLILAVIVALLAIGAYFGTRIYLGDSAQAAQAALAALDSVPTVSSRTR